VTNQTFASVTDFVDREHDSWLGIVIVVADGYTPRNELRIVVTEWEVVGLHWVIIDGSAHDVILADGALSEVFDAKQGNRADACPRRQGQNKGSSTNFEKVTDSHF
jgi:hypothetical protein